MGHNKIDVYWHEYGRVLVQRYAGQVTHITLARAISEIQRSTIHLRQRAVPFVIIDLSQRTENMDTMVFTAGNVRRLLPDGFQSPAGVHVIIVDQYPNGEPIQCMGDMLRMIGYRVTLLKSFEEAVNVAERYGAARAG